VSTTYSRAVPFGATYLGNGRTRFRLWAPGQDGAAVEVEGSAPLAMKRQADGWFDLETPCRPGARYSYRLASGQSVPDPASRAQADDVHGPSLVVDPTSYRWRCADWRGRPWHEAVIYELHVGTYGGFGRVQADLDRLSRLGITAIELMPINDFPGQRNWGYDGVLPFAPDRAYGSPDELKALIDDAHDRRLLVSTSSTITSGRTETISASTPRISSATTSPRRGAPPSISASRRCAASSSRTRSTG